MRRGRSRVGRSGLSPRPLGAAPPVRQRPWARPQPHGGRGPAATAPPGDPRHAHARRSRWRWLDTTPWQKGGRNDARPPPDRYKARPEGLGIDIRIPRPSPWALARRTAPRGGNPAWGDCHRRPKMTKSGSRGMGTNSRCPSHSGGPPRRVGHPRRPRPR